MFGPVSNQIGLSPLWPADRSQLFAIKTPDALFCKAASTTGCLPAVILNLRDLSNFGRHQFSDIAISASATVRSISARAFAAFKILSENSMIFNLV